VRRSPAVVAAAVRRSPAVVAAAVRRSPAVVAVVARRRLALLVTATGAAWVLLVAAMAQAGFSGEPRYLLPGVTLLSVAGAAGLVLLGRRGVAVTVVVLLAAAVPRVADLPRLRDAQAHQWALSQDLAAAVAAAGGRAAVLACGTPYVGRLRGPLMAYRLEVPKRDVEPDDPPRPPGVVFRARLTAASLPAPAAAPPFVRRARAGEWEVLAHCTAN
jgi:hypothetical protein